MTDRFLELQLKKRQEEQFKENIYTCVVCGLKLGETREFYLNLQIQLTFPDFHQRSNTAK